MVITSFPRRKLNDVIVRIPHGLKTIKKLVVYFGGDVQDFHRVMQANESNQKYSNWSLESTSDILGEKFGEESLIITVRPSQYYLGTFAKFVNFVETDWFSNPTYNHKTDDAWKQVGELLIGVESRLKTDSNGNFPTTDDSELLMVGFSKGCVVLNQLLHETVFINERTKEERTPYLPVLEKLSGIYWLDGGHNGTDETWVTEPRVLTAFSHLILPNNVRIHVAVTPYQMNDKRRPHVAHEKIAFVQQMKKMGFLVDDNLYFENQPRAIDLHFEILRVFQV